MSAVIAFLVILPAGWALTPGGLLGKADAIGYAVCHRIDLRSFHLAGRQLPLCARCTGTFLGALVGGVALAAAGRGRAALWPPRGLSLLLGALLLPWLVDGTNSSLALLPGFPHLYTPQNWLRLATGTLVGLALPAFFLPALNQTLWRAPRATPVLRRPLELVAYLALAPALIALVLSGNELLLYPAALLSSVGVLALLTGIYLVITAVLLRQENRIDNLAAAWPLVLLALTLALLHIGAVDLIRFELTRTWGGLPLPG